MNGVEQHVFATLMTFGIGFGLGSLAGIALGILWERRREG